MSWTPERVERLTKLWNEGYSAADIAKELGGVTRNAVIGRVHRLGLSGRATPTKKVRRPKRPQWTSPQSAFARSLWDEGITTEIIARRVNERFGTSYSPKAIQNRMARIGAPRRDALACANAGKAKARQKALERGKSEPKPPQQLPVSIAPPHADPKTIIEVGHNECRWPVGEARGADMLCCGAPVRPGARQPYCEHHLEAESKRTQYHTDQIAKKIHTKDRNPRKGNGRIDMDFDALKEKERFHVG